MSDAMTLQAIIDDIEALPIPVQDMIDAYESALETADPDADGPDTSKWRMMDCPYCHNVFCVGPLWKKLKRSGRRYIARWICYECGKTYHGNHNQ